MLDKKVKLAGCWKSLETPTGAVNRLTGSGGPPSARTKNKMLSYRRETALHGAL